MRFSVSILLAGITLVGICISALAGSNELSIQLMTFVVLLSVIVMASLALVSSGQRRIFAIGFLVGCLPYLYLTQPYNHTRREALITGVALEMIDTYLKLSQERRTPAGETVHLLENSMAHINGPKGAPTSKTWQEIEDMGYMRYAYSPGHVPAHRHYMAIGHLIVALMIGCGNGALACCLGRTATCSQNRRDGGDSFPSPTT